MVKSHQSEPKYFVLFYQVFVTSTWLLSRPQYSSSSSNNGPQTSVGQWSFPGNYVGFVRYCSDTKAIKRLRDMRLKTGKSKKNKCTCTIIVQNLPKNSWMPELELLVDNLLTQYALQQLSYQPIKKILVEHWIVVCERFC